MASYQFAEPLKLNLNLPLGALSSVLLAPEQNSSISAGFVVQKKRPSGGARYALYMSF